MQNKPSLFRAKEKSAICYKRPTEFLCILQRDQHKLRLHSGLYKHSFKITRSEIF